MKKLFLKLLSVLKDKDCPGCHGLSSIDQSNGAGLCKWCYGVVMDTDTLPCVTIKQSLRYHFVPQRDITVYELSCLLPYMMSSLPFYQEDYDRLGPDVQRHLVKVN